MLYLSRQPTGPASSPTQRKSPGESRIRLQHMATRRDPLLTDVGLLVPFGALLLVAPGALVMFVADRFLRLRFDLTECWAWAVESSVVTACAMALRSRDVLGPYMLLAVMTSAVVLAAGVGTHSQWAAEMLREYVP